MAKITLDGSCICQQLSYRITGTPIRFFHCHCSRCRKTTGTGHGTNILVKTDKINWSGDQSFIGSYKIPEAKSYTSCFCKNCGSRLPWFMPANQIAVIPAGSLDSEAPDIPRARIYYGSRASWSCSDEPLPHYDTFPS